MKKLLLLLLFGCTKQQPTQPPTEVTVIEIDMNLPLLPVRTNTWADPPGVINCTNTSPVTLDQVKLGFLPLEEKGEEIFDYIEVDCYGPCSIAPGFITVTGKDCYFETITPDAGQVTLGVAKNFLRDGAITASVIELSIDLIPLITHEAAHAFGWSHCRTPLHLMHPNMTIGSLDMEGMYED